MILVVGGAGYIGSHMVQELVEKREKVLVLDNFSRSNPRVFESLKKKVTFIQGDLGDRGLLESLFKTHEISTVLHFAAYCYVGESVENPGLYFQNNVANTITLLEAMRKNSVKRFIFSSTCATYGNPKESVLKEDHPQNPINPYGLSKLMVEQCLREYARADGFQVVVFRYFNAAGAHPSGAIGEAHDPETHLIPLCLRAVKNGEEVTVFGDDYPTEDGTCIRDYVHVCDLAKAHRLGVEYLGKLKEGIGVFEDFNLGTERGSSILEVIHACEEVTGKKLNYRLGERRPGDPAKLIADSSKAKTKLGWTPFFHLKQTIETAWKWHNQ